MPRSGGSGGGSFGGSGGGFSRPTGGYHNYGRVNDPLHNHYRYDVEKRNIGCSVLIAVACFIMAIIAVAFFAYEDNSYNDSYLSNPGFLFSELFLDEIAQSEPMKSNAVFTGKYIEDKTENGDYISDPEKLESSLEYFHKTTGIIPYLYLTEEYPDEDMTDAGYNKYMELFPDEGHLLMYFVLSDESYEFELTVGDDVFEYLGDDGVEWAIRFRLDNMDSNIYAPSDFGDVFAGTISYIADLIYPTADDDDVSDGVIETQPDSGAISDSQGNGSSILFIVLIGIAGVAVLILLIAIVVVLAKRRKRKNDFTDVEDYLRENGSTISDDIYGDMSDKFDYKSSKNDWEE